MLEDVHTSQSEKGLKYNVIFRLLNAADYGIPQFRQRVFIIGFRSDLKVEWHFPKASHGIDALLHEQWVTGEYWDHHKVPLRGRPKINPRHVKRVEQIRVDGINPCGPKLRFLTTRDAIYGLPNPRRKNDQFNHDYRPGAKPYPGHTGSDLDLPSKTLKAGDHGVPGGENMINYRNGQYRYFTVRESARLQTFPDNYQFYGSWTEAMRQIGNAVPVELARIIGVSLKTELDRLNDKK
jgi:DNA (cytosine-5)-methyltransferase 1